MWCDVLPVVAKFVLICQQKNLNFLSAMQTYSKMLADLEVLTAGPGPFEQSFLLIIIIIIIITIIIIIIIILLLLLYEKHKHQWAISIRRLVHAQDFQNLCV
jgi:hypothetical protein